MKNKILPLSLPIIAIGIAVALFSCTPTGDRKQEAPNITSNDVPDMDVLTLDGKRLSLKQVQGKMALVMFQPECEDCQREAREIRDHLDAFKGYRLYFLSTAPMSQITAFSRDYDLNTQDNVIFAQTTINNVIHNLGEIPAPSVYIYSAAGKLIRAFNGETEIEEITESL